MAFSLVYGYIKIEMGTVLSVKMDLKSQGQLIASMKFDLLDYQIVQDTQVCYGEEILLYTNWGMLSKWLLMQKRVSMSTQN